MRGTTSQPGAVLVAVVLASSLIWASGCGNSGTNTRTHVASPCFSATVNYKPSKGAQAGLAQIPWIRVSPPSAGLVGYLFYYDLQNAWRNQRLAPLRMFSGGESPDGRMSMKILWDLRHGNAPAVLDVRATRTDGPGSSFQQLASTSSDKTQFPSIIDIPAPGCWRLTLMAGATTGQVVVDVVPGKSTQS